MVTTMHTSQRHKISQSLAAIRSAVLKWWYYKVESPGGVASKASPVWIGFYCSFLFVVPSGPPRDLLVLPRGKDTIKVLWSIPSAGDCNGVITKYEIILYKQNVVTQTYPVKGETLYKDIGGLEPNQQYFIGVRAYTKVGPGPYSRNLSHSTGKIFKICIIS